MPVCNQAGFAAWGWVTQPGDETVCIQLRLLCALSKLGGDL